MLYKKENHSEIIVAFLENSVIFFCTLERTKSEKMYRFKNLPQINVNGMNKIILLISKTLKLLRKFKNISEIINTFSKIKNFKRFV